MKKEEQGLNKIFQHLAQFGFGIYLAWRAVCYHTRRNLRIVLPAILLILAAVVYLVIFPPYQPPERSGAGGKTVYIPRGSSLREIAGILSDNRVLQHEELFVLLGKISGYQNGLKAGMIKVPEEMPPWHLLIYLQHPDFAEIKVTFPEGITAREMAGILHRELGSDSVRFMHRVADSAFCDSLGVHANSLEGYLLPETYYFSYGMSEQEIVRLLVNNTLRIFEPDSVQRQLARLEMTRHQILTLASIIEGEVVVDSERVIVSSVYHNRLNRGWLLQADPTIQYILPGEPRRLLLRDLKIDSPYNTYKYKGLPPGPINNPGKKSILAAIFPADTGYMYFVATGDGGHNFARTAAQHARNKAEFDRVRRQVRRRQNR